MKFVAGLYNADLHAKRVLSLANATLGVLASASLAVHAIGQGLAQAMGTLSKHGIKGSSHNRFFGLREFYRRIHI